MSTVSLEPTIVNAKSAEFIDMPWLPTELWVHGKDTGSRFSVVIHTIPPKTLAAPPHRHCNEDEYSYILEGEMGAMLGDHFVSAGPGNLVFKPRNQIHTFWNAGDVPCRLIEIISASGFEDFFLRNGRLPWRTDPETAMREVQALGDEYGLEFFMDQAPAIIERFGLNPPF